MFTPYAENAKIDVQALKSESLSMMFVLSEEARRMEEMSKMYGNMGMMNLPKSESTLVINSLNPLVKKVVELEDGELKDLICKEMIDIAKLSHNTLTGDDKNTFIQKTNEILMRLL